MSNGDPSEREILQDGISGQFWAWFSDLVTREWGPAGLRYQQAVRAASQSSSAVAELQQVLKVQEELLALMKAPAMRLQQLQAQAQPTGPTMSRRGPGL